MRVLRALGVCDDTWRTTYQSVVVTKLLYAASARSGFISSSDWERVCAFFRHGKRCNFCIRLGFRLLNNRAKLLILTGNHMEQWSLAALSYSATNCRCSELLYPVSSKQQTFTYSFWSSNWLKLHRTNAIYWCRNCVLSITVNKRIWIIDLFDWPIFLFLISRSLLIRLNSRQLLEQWSTVFRQVFAR